MPHLTAGTTPSHPEDAAIDPQTFLDVVRYSADGLVPSSGPACHTGEVSRFHDAANSAAVELEPGGA